jgi:hypothetical protein
VTFKSRSNKNNMGIMACILIRCTNDKNLEMIQPLVEELQNFLCFWFWPPGGQAKKQIGPKFGLGGQVT